jgi:hypothetical protein
MEPLTMVGNEKHHNVYVIALDLVVMNDKCFREANPHYIEGKPCVYVGMTGRTPDERFRQHKEGYKSFRYPHKYGKYLRRKRFEHLNPTTYKRAASLEVELARQLRNRGYGVWQN